MLLDIAVVLGILLYPLIIWSLVLSDKEEQLKIETWEKYRETKGGDFYTE